MARGAMSIFQARPAPTPRRIAVRAGDLFTDRRQALIITPQLMKIVGVNFDHMHMGDLLRMAYEHPRAEIVGVCDEAPERMRAAVANFSIPPERVFTDYGQC